MGVIITIVHMSSCFILCLFCFYGLSSCMICIENIVQSCRNRAKWNIGCMKNTTLVCLFLRPEHIPCNPGQHTPSIHAVLFCLAYRTKTCRPTHTWFPANSVHWCRGTVFCTLMQDSLIDVEELILQTSTNICHVKTDYRSLAVAIFTYLR